MVFAITASVVLAVLGFAHLYVLEGIIGAELRKIRKEIFQLRACFDDDNNGE